MNHQNRIHNKLTQLSRMLGGGFAYFRSYYFKHYHKLPDSGFHKELYTMLAGITHNRGSKLALAAPRGSSKSTLISLEYVIYCICYKLERFIIMISSTTDQATGFLSEIKNELMTNPRLITDFPDICEIGQKPGPQRWRNNEIITRNGIKVVALGSNQQIRGRRNREERPSLIILDDFETDERFQTPDQYDKLHRWLTKSVLKSGTSQTNVIFTGTIHHYHSLLAQYTHAQMNPGWIKRIYRSVISPSAHPALWEKWEKIYNHHENFEDQEGPAAARLFFEANQAQMLEGTQVLWPEQKDYYALMTLREDDGHASFDSEMQNEPINPSECLFNLEELHYWDDQYESEEELLSVIGDHKEFYGACDPSLGKHKHRGDFSAIISIVRDSDTGIIYVIDADISRRTPSKIIDDTLVYCKTRRYERFGFEVNQFQVLMAQELEDRGNKAGIYPSIEQIQNTGDKVARIESLQPLVKNGAVRFSRKHRTLLEQMKYFPKWKYDDGIDALEMAVRLCKDYPTGPLAWDIDTYPGR